MKPYVREMSLVRRKALWRAGCYSQATIEHIIKVLVYNEVEGLDADSWINEIAEWLHEVDGITVKPRETKLTKNNFMNTTFSAMGDELNDYRRELKIFLFHNKRRYFEYEFDELYPEFEITDDLVKRFMDCCYDIMDETIPMLRDKRNHSKEEYKTVLTNIFNNYI